MIISHWRDPVRQNHKKAEINLSENAIYRVKDGILEKLDAPCSGFGKQVINWQDGKPTYYEVRYTKK